MTGSVASPGFGGLLSSFDRVAPRLWMGGKPDLLSGFDVLVLCAKEYQPRGQYPHMTVIHVPLDDSGIPPTRAEIHAALVASREVSAELRRGRRVLVTCMQGRNRSGLVTALALRRLGASPEQAIRMVRAARGEHALANPWFAELVRSVRIDG